MNHSRIVVPALLTAHVALLAWSSVRHSPSVGEIVQLPSGLSHWESQRFDLYEVNPPLVRSVAALPVWLFCRDAKWNHYDAASNVRAEWLVGRDFMQSNGANVFWYFVLARWVCISFSLVGAVACYTWANALYGPRAGILALSLWCFAPSVLGNGAMISADLGAAALGLLASYAFWQFHRHASGFWTMGCAVLLGAAVLAKTTWMLLFVLWPTMWFIDGALSRKAVLPGVRPTKQQLFAVLLGAVAMINLGYCFEGSLTRLADHRFTSNLGTDDYGENRFKGSWLGAVRVPLPRNFVEGMDATKAEFEKQRWSYLRGTWKRGGWWYYYLYALAVKVPLGLMLLWVYASHRSFSGNAPGIRNELFVLLPAFAVIGLVSTQTGFNHHVRYVLPALPLLFVWASRAVNKEAASSALPRKRVYRLLIAVSVVAFFCSSLWSYPHCMSYFNEMAGGPLRGKRHLSDSNVDWGQDLFFLKGWVNSHPDAQPLYVFTVQQWFYDPELVGIHHHQVPLESVEPKEGWYAVSVRILHGYRHHVWFLRELRPRHHIGYSIQIFYVSPEQAELFRQARPLASSSSE